MFNVIDQMILENGITNDPKQVGFYSGVIESIFSIMSFLTSTSNKSFELLLLSIVLI